MNEAVEKILTMLSQMEPLNANSRATQTSLSTQRAKAGWWVLWGGCVLLPGVATACAVVKAVYGVTATSMWLRISFAILLVVWALCCAVIWWPQIVSARDDLRFRRFERSRMIQELTHDRLSVARLLQFNRSDLESADVWLQIVQERRQTRAAMFVGARDKVALFSLVATAWTVFDALSKFSLLKDFSPFVVACTFFVVIVAVGLFIGLAAGAIMLTVVYVRYSYYRDLIAMALRSSAAEAGSA